MAGDVNLFFNDFEDEHLAEMEVFIFFLIISYALLFISLILIKYYNI